MCFFFSVPWVLHFLQCTECDSTSTFTNSILYKAEGFKLRDSTDMKCDSVLFTCHDGQDL